VSTVGLYAASGDGVARLDEAVAARRVELSLAGSGAQCVAVDPADPDTVYGRSPTVSPGPLPAMPYALTARDGRLFAGLADGQLREPRPGESWMPLRLRRELEPLVALGCTAHRASERQPVG
jgi:hypothetical protein